MSTEKAVVRSHLGQNNDMVNVVILYPHKGQAMPRSRSRRASNYNPSSGTISQPLEPLEQLPKILSSRHLIGQSQLEPEGLKQQLQSNAGSAADLGQAPKLAKVRQLEGEYEKDFNFTYQSQL